ncbi:MAG: hypothetical protein IID36_05330 [Planctomycetes bacterium]|nr:hypothetical protein [Planctomycetota bacterium]
MRHIISGLGVLTLCVIGCPSGGEQSSSGSSELVAEQSEPLTEYPYEFDGAWSLNTTYAPDQEILGTSRLEFYVEYDDPSCVTPGTFLDGLDWWRRALGIRPVTLNDDVLEIRFQYEFAPNSLEDFETFAGESLVDVTIVGERVSHRERDDGLIMSAYYDVVVLEFYVFSEVQLTSTGTLWFRRGIHPDSFTCAFWDTPVFHDPDDHQHLKR